MWSIGSPNRSARLSLAVTWVAETLRDLEMTTPDDDVHDDLRCQPAARASAPGDGWVPARASTLVVAASGRTRSGPPARVIVATATGRQVTVLNARRASRAVAPVVRTSSTTTTPRGSAAARNVPATLACALAPEAHLVPAVAGPGRRRSAMCGHARAGAAPGRPGPRAGGVVQARGLGGPARARARGPARPARRAGAPVDRRVDRRRPGPGPAGRPGGAGHRP